MLHWSTRRGPTAPRRPRDDARRREHRRRAESRSVGISGGRAARACRSGRAVVAEPRLPGTYDPSRPLVQVGVVHVVDRVDLKARRAPERKKPTEPYASSRPRAEQRGRSARRPAAATSNGSWLNSRPSASPPPTSIALRRQSHPGRRPIAPRCELAPRCARHQLCAGATPGRGGRRREAAGRLMTGCGDAERPPPTRREGPPPASAHHGAVEVGGRRAARRALRIDTAGARRGSGGARATARRRGRAERRRIDLGGTRAVGVRAIWRRGRLELAAPWVNDAP